MRISIIVICLLLGSASLSIGQTPEIDSLIRNLAKFRQDDSLRAQLFLDAAVKLRKINPAKAKAYYDTSVYIAQKAGENEIEARANHGIAICNGMLGNYPEAIQSFHATIALAQKFKLAGRTADGYNGLGVVYKRLGDYSQSLEYYSEALPIYDSVGDFRGLGAAHENIGVLYDLMKEPDRAMEHYEKALAIYRRENETILASLARGNIAILLIGRGRYDEALSILYDNKRMYDSLQRYPNSIGVAGNIAYVLIQKKNYKGAKDILLANLPNAKKYELKQEESNIINNLFEIAFAENNLQQALSYAQEYQRLAYELDSREYIKISYSLLARLWEKNGNYSKALDAYKQYKAWSDSVFNDENNRAFRAQEIKVEVLAKNKQLAEQRLTLNFLQDQVKQENRMKWLLVAAAVFLLATVFLLYQKFTERKRVSEILAVKNEEISRQKIHIEEINYQLENRMLRAQINPHFIFNSLSSIQHFITSDDRTAALKYLSKFSNLLRKVLESSITGNVLLSEEIQLVSMYLELESLRFDGNFSYNIHLDNALDTHTIEMPTMILQPLIENAVLHGLMPKEGDRKLDISFHLEDGNVEIKVQDNGIGREASHQLKQGKRKANPSRGISVTKQRLATLKEKHGWQISMTYEDLVHVNGEPAGTCVTLQVPIFIN